MTREFRKRKEFEDKKQTARKELENFPEQGANSSKKTRDVRKRLENLKTTRSKPLERN